MKKLIITALLVLGIGIQANAETLELLTMEYPPYFYKEGGEVKGIAIDIIQEAFHRMKRPIRIRIFPWSRAIKFIKDGEADGLFTAVKNPEREKFADYSKVVMVEMVSLFVRKDSPITFDGDLSTMGKYKFGGVRGFGYGEAFDNAVKNKIITKIHLVTRGEQVVKMLILKRFQVLPSDRYFALYSLNKLGEVGKVKELSPQIAENETYLIFSKKRNLAHIRDKFDKVLIEMRRDGTYDRIMENFFRMVAEGN
jgi:polar amino acid transport system substrate-binding protein